VRGPILYLAKDELSSSENAELVYYMLRISIKRFCVGLVLGEDAALLSGGQHR